MVKRHKVGRAICNEKPDMVCLQETHMLAKDTSLMKHKLYTTQFFTTTKEKKQRMSCVPFISIQL